MICSRRARTRLGAEYSEPFDRAELMHATRAHLAQDAVRVVTDQRLHPAVGMGITDPEMQMDYSTQCLRIFGLELASEIAAVFVGLAAE
jgi:hypothetical protein